MMEKQLLFVKNDLSQSSINLNDVLDESNQVEDNVKVNVTHRKKSDSYATDKELVGYFEKLLGRLNVKNIQKPKLKHTINIQKI